MEFGFVEPYTKWYHIDTSYVESIIMELGGTCENPLYAKMENYGYLHMETLFMPIEPLWLSTSWDLW